MGVLLVLCFVVLCFGGTAAVEKKKVNLVPGKLEHYTTVLCVSRQATLWDDSHGTKLSLFSPAVRGMMFRRVGLSEDGKMTRVTDKQMFPKAVWLSSKQLADPNECGNKSEMEEVDKMISQNLAAHGIEMDTGKKGPAPAVPLSAKEKEKMKKMHISQSELDEVNKMVAAAMMKGGGATLPPPKEEHVHHHLERHLEKEQEGKRESGEHEKDEKEHEKKRGVKKENDAEEEDVPEVSLGPFLSIRDARVSLRRLTTEGTACGDEDVVCSQRIHKMILVVMNEIKRLEHEKEVERLMSIGREVLESLPRYHPPRDRRRRRPRRRRRCGRQCERRRNSLVHLKKSRKRVRSLYVRLVKCEKHQGCVNKVKVRIIRALKLQRMLLIAVCKRKNDECKRRARKEYVKQRANLTNELIRIKEMGQRVSKRAEEIEARIKAREERRRRRREARRQREEEERRREKEEQEAAVQEAMERREREKQMERTAREEALRKEEESEALKQAMEEREAQIAQRNAQMLVEADMAQQAQEVQQQQQQGQQQMNPVVSKEAQQEMEEVQREVQQEQQGSEVQKVHHDDEVQQPQEMGSFVKNIHGILHPQQQVAQEQQVVQQPPQQQEVLPPQQQVVQPPQQQVVQQIPQQVVQQIPQAEPSNEVYCARAGVSIYPAPNSFEPKISTTISDTVFRVIRVVNAINNQYLEVRECGGIMGVQYVRSSDVDKCDVICH